MKNKILITLLFFATCLASGCKKDVSIPPSDFTFSVLPTLKSVTLTVTDHSMATGRKNKWDCGDGTTEEGQLASHTYTSSGTYKVVHYVFTYFGMSKTEKMVTI